MSNRFMGDVGMTQSKGEDFQLAKRRASYHDISNVLEKNPFNLSDTDIKYLEQYDLTYRTIAGILYNFASSGHPGGALSAGRVSMGLLFNAMDYDIGDPLRREADCLTYTAGHKAMGVYSMYALRNEFVRASKPDLLPKKETFQIRLEDLLGFRRNPVQDTPLYQQFGAKALDGHLTPGTPFVRVATGPSGVGITSSFGWAFAALDSYREQAPKCHVIEGEAGLTPGRCYEAIATAASNQLRNLILHVDWNQASIDSDRVCREDGKPGDYVQWDPRELFYVNDWNVIYVDDGFDFKKIMAAQQLALTSNNDQPTAIVYRTVKGWRYGFEGKKSHGAGHKFCSDAFYEYMSPFEQEFNVKFPRFDASNADAAAHEKAYYDHLLVVREVAEAQKDLAQFFGDRIALAKERLEAAARKPHAKLPNLKKIYDNPELDPAQAPEGVLVQPGEQTTLRGVLGNVLSLFNQVSGGGIIGGSADLYASTSLANLNKGFPEGFYRFADNADCRLVSNGGITEDSIGGFMSGVSAFGNHIGAGSSYAAFITCLQHLPARVHSIAQQTKRELYDEPNHPFIIVNGHAGIKTGEDGPTHADPQPLQLMQENFCKGSLITLTPWDPQEIWPLMLTALRQRPAVVTPFVTRPNETVVDRKALGLPPAVAAVKGVYAFRTADPKGGNYGGTLVLQGSGVANEFVTHVLPELDKKNINMNIYYVASAELFDALDKKEQEEIFPESRAQEAMGITGFTLPTLYRWVASKQGRERSLYPLKSGHYLGSGKAHMVMRQAKLDGPGQLEAVLSYANSFK